MSRIQNQNNKTSIRKSVYVGINIESDGFCAAVNNRRKIIIECVKTDKVNINKKIFAWLYSYSLFHNVKIISVGLVDCGGKNSRLASDIWLKEDIVPYCLNVKNGTSREKARQAAIEVTRKFKGNDLVDVRFDTKRKVIVESLGSLKDFKKTVSREEFDLLEHLAEKFKKQNGKLVFFSSTPQGGGVALMRHALIRLLRLLSIDAEWYVMSSKNEIFNITKKKFHNILQGVSGKSDKLTAKDKKAFNDWSRKNAEKFAKVFKKAKVIVIDDPQPSGLVPYIKKNNPSVKIIYRSHIQIEAGLIEKKNSSQNITWNFIWNNIKNVDLFISHPITKFIPHNVPLEKIVLMGAATDYLDGLNKKLTHRHMRYYFDMFNDILEKSGQKPLNLHRSYIIQIARFDPSKGIPDVIMSYRKLRKKIDKRKWPNSKIPQLVIAGHSAIDDPEGASIYEATLNMLKMDNYKSYAPDIKVARLPDSDQTLNTLMRGSFIALQLSHKEGFEIKVSEALDKGKPVIAYKSGGISLQIENNINGYLIKAGDTAKVADIIYELLIDRKKYLKLCENAKEKVERDFFTVGNTIKWLYLSTELLEKGRIKGNRQRVREIIEKKRKVQLRKYLPMWLPDFLGFLKSLGK